MKTKKDFSLKEVCGEFILIAEGKTNIDFSEIISMNESSALLWRKIEGKEFTEETLRDILLEHYEVEPEVALADVQKLIQTWKNSHLIEE